MSYNIGYLGSFVAALVTFESRRVLGCFQGLRSWHLRARPSLNASWRFTFTRSITRWWSVNKPSRRKSLALHHLEVGVNFFMVEILPWQKRFAWRVEKT